MQVRPERSVRTSCLLLRRAIQVYVNLVIHGEIAAVVKLFIVLVRCIWSMNQGILSIFIGKEICLQQPFVFCSARETILNKSTPYLLSWISIRHQSIVNSREICAHAHTYISIYARCLIPITWQNSCFSLHCIRVRIEVDLASTELSQDEYYDLFDSLNGPVNHGLPSS